MPCCKILCDLRPLISTTNPTPQASCSNAGSYKPCLLGGPSLKAGAGAPSPLGLGVICSCCCIVAIRFKAKIRCAASDDQHRPVRSDCASDSRLWQEPKDAETAFRTHTALARGVVKSPGYFARPSQVIDSESVSLR